MTATTEIVTPSEQQGFPCNDLPRLLSVLVKGIPAQAKRELYVDQEGVLSSNPRGVVQTSDERNVYSRTNFRTSPRIPRYIEPTITGFAEGIDGSRVVCVRLEIEWDNGRVMPVFMSWDETAGQAQMLIATGQDAFNPEVTQEVGILRKDWRLIHDNLSARQVPNTHWHTVGTMTKRGWQTEVTLPVQLETVLSGNTLLQMDNNELFGKGERLAKQGFGDRIGLIVQSIKNLI